VRYLARLGVPTRIAGVTTKRPNIQSSILSIAADESINLLVMGGYGHSRLKETVFGGVTREMLESMTVPTLVTLSSGGSRRDSTCWLDCPHVSSF
jgi:nucleotide-binding universal stress UspA family protein